MRGVVSGVLALVVLQVVLQPGPSSRLSGAAGWLEAATRRLLSPQVAGVPDRRRSGGSAGSGGSSSSTRR